MTRILMIAAALAVAGCAARAPDRATPQAAKAADPVTCSYERGVGSNIPKKVCMTASQREAAERDAADTMQALQRTGGSGGRDAGL